VTDHEISLEWGLITRRSVPPSAHDYDIAVLPNMGTTITALLVCRRAETRRLRSSR